MLTATSVKLLKQLEALTNRVFEDKVIKQKYPSEKWGQIKAAALTRQVLETVYMSIETDFGHSMQPVSGCR